MSAPSIRIHTARLSPQSVGAASRVQNGTDDLQQIELIQLQQNAHVFNVLADPFPSPGASVAHLQTGNDSKPDIQRITLSPLPYDGTWDLSYDGQAYTQIPFDITGSGLQALIGGQVAKRASGIWDITTADNREVSVATVDVTNLTVPKGVKGTLGLNTLAVWLAFIGSQEKVKTFTLEVQLVWLGEDPQTIFQGPVEIARNVINLATLEAATLLGMQTAVSAIFGDAAFVYSTAITGLRGGGTNLDAVATENLALGARYEFLLNDTIQKFILKAGAADVDDPTGQVAPLDYDATSNNKHWELQA